MKLYFEKKTFDVNGENGTLFAHISRLSGVQVHAPCGGHGICKKCLVCALPKEGCTLTAHDIPFDAAEQQAFIRKCHVPESEAGRVCIVYSCLVPEEETAMLDTVYLPDYEQLTGAGVADKQGNGTSAADFHPVIRVKKCTLTKPTIAEPLDTFTNLKQAVQTAFAGSFDTFRLHGGVDIPDDVLSKTSDLLHRDVYDVYATVAVSFHPSGICSLTLTDVAEEETLPLALACDIGTTTVAVSLWRMDTGTLLAEKVTENPQRRHGSDVISRMSYAIQNETGAETLFTEVLQAVRGSAQDLLERAAADNPAVQADLDRIVYVTIAGNSTMQHMFTKISTASISTVPFFLSTAYGYSMPAGTLFAKADGLGHPFCHPNAPVYFAPLSASYVGGDITFGLAYLLTKHPDLKTSSSIFMDLGTNGELCCIDGRPAQADSRKKYLFAATAAGPALEGAHIQMGMSATDGAIYHVEPDLEAGTFRCPTVHDTPAVGICGSGVISAVSACLKTGLITGFGRICDDGEPEDEAYEDIYPAFEDRISEDDDGKLSITLDGDVVLTEGDIRQIQTAKAAISAGVTVLLSKAGIAEEDVDDLYIAGSFGGGIDVHAAAHIGLLPADAVHGENIHAAGNTSAKGASLFLFSKEFRDNLGDVMAHSSYIELSSDPSFTDAYVNGMLFSDDE